MANKLPNVFNYLDAVFYLQDYYKARKGMAKGFSYETWSYELNIKSRAFIRLIILGKKKISPKFVEAFSEQVFATKAEQEYFHSLVSYSQASTQKDKQLFGARLTQIQRRTLQQKHVEDFSGFVSSPQLPRLLTLLSFKDIVTTSENLQKLMAISLDEVERSLKHLAELGLAEQKREGEVIVWKSKNEKFKVKDSKGSIDLFKFHEQSLHEAIAAFTLPKELRRYKSLLLSFSEEELKTFYQNMDEFATEQFNRFSGDHYEGRRLFQINFNIYPVAKAIEEV